MSSADNEGRPPEDETTTSVEPPAGATPAEEEAPLTPEAAPQEDATAAEQERLADAVAEEQAQAPAEAVAADAAPSDAPAESEAEPEAEPEPEPEPEPDPVRQPMLDRLREALGDALVDSEVRAGDIWVRVERSAWRKAGEVCKRSLGMDYFCFLSGMDWLPNPDLSGEKVWDPDVERAAPAEGAEQGPRYETGVAGGETRFQVFARLYSTQTKVGITLKADLDEADPRIESWIPVYRGADWHERECWEMYGFQFDGHPDLRHIYLPAGFEGFPLRKDFPLLARELKPWPGLVDKEPIPGEEEEADATAGEEATSS